MGVTTPANVTTPQPVSEGVFIQNEFSQKCLDLPGGNTDNGNNLWVWDCLFNDQQIWQFSSGQLVLASNPMKCLDLPDNDFADGRVPMIWDCVGTPQQQWSYDPDFGTIYLSTSNDATRCLGVPIETQNPGLDVGVFECDGNDILTWNLKSSENSSTTLDPSPPPTPPSFFSLRNEVYQRCLDLPGGDATNGNVLWAWECMAVDGQRWAFSDGQLVSAISPSKCVDLPGNDYSDGKTPMIWDCVGTPQQQWDYDDSQGTLYLSSSQDATRCMGVPLDAPNPGLDVGVFECDGTDTLRWMMDSESVVLV